MVSLLSSTSWLRGTWGCLRMRNDHQKNVTAVKDFSRSWINTRFYEGVNNVLNGQTNPNLLDGLWTVARQGNIIDIIQVECSNPRSEFKLIVRQTKWTILQKMVHSMRQKLILDPVKLKRLQHNSLRTNISITDTPFLPLQCSSPNGFEDWENF